MLSKQGQRSGACLLRLMVNWIPRTADEITFTPIKNATRVFLPRKPQNNSREENESDRNSFQICRLAKNVFLLLFIHGTMLMLCVTIKYWLLVHAFIHTEHMVTQMGLEILHTIHEGKAPLWIRFCLSGYRRPIPDPWIGIGGGSLVKYWVVGNRTSSVGFALHPKKYLQF